MTTRPEWMGGNTKGLAIVRVSSAKQGDRESPKSQGEGMARYAADVGIDLVEVVEIHESAKDSEARPEFNKAIERALLEGRRHIIFWVADRIGRNMTDYERLEKLAREDRIALHIAHDRRVLHKNSPDSDWFATDTAGLAAKQTARDMRRRATESMEHKAGSGWFPGKAPFGYVNVKEVGPDGQTRDRGGTIEPAQWGREVLRKMHEMRLSGCSLKVITERLVETPELPARWRRRFGQSGAPGTVHRILTSPFYKGMFFYKGVLLPGLHEPLLTPFEWDRLQATFGIGHAPLRSGVREALFAGFFTCAECGCRITYDPKVKNGKLYKYYRCANGRRMHERLVYVREEELARPFSWAVDSIQVDQAFAQELLTALNAGHEALRTARRAEAAKFKRDLEALEADEDRLVDLLVSRTLDEAAYRRKVTQVREERARKLAQLETANADIDRAYLFTAERVLELGITAKERWFSRDLHERRALLDRLVSNPTLRGKSVEYQLQKPFAILSEIRSGQQWRTP